MTTPPVTPSLSGAFEPQSAGDPSGRRRYRSPRPVAGPAQVFARRTGRLLRGAAVTGAAVFAGPVPLCLAAVSGASWRGTYDIVMMWVNFVILAALMIKFLRKPLRDFLSSQRDSLAKEIDRLTRQKEQTTAEITAFQETMAARRERFAAIHQTIIETGEKERQELIDTAHRQAGIMIDSARQRIDHQLRKATTVLRSELIEAAMAIAIAQLPRHVSPENNQAWVERFIHDIDASTF